jgi:hypothetical protein
MTERPSGQRMQSAPMKLPNIAPNIPQVEARMAAGKIKIVLAEPCGTQPKLKKIQFLKQLSGLNNNEEASSAEQ